MTHDIESPDYKFIVGAMEQINRTLEILSEIRRCGKDGLSHQQTMEVMRRLAEYQSVLSSSALRVGLDAVTDHSAQDDTSNERESAG